MGFGAFVRQTVARYSGILLLFAPTCVRGSDSFGPALNPPSSYTVKFNIAYQWLSPDGRIKDKDLITVKVAVEPHRLLIQPWAPDSANSNLVFMTWASSPYSMQEWIVQAPTKGPADKIETVAIDRNPTLRASDSFGQIGRLLYISPDQPCLAGISRADFFYLSLDSRFYKPSELDFKVLHRMVNNVSVVSQLTAFTPNWCYYGNSGKKLFKGPPFKRKMWQLIINDYTNWDGALFPSAFKFERFQDPVLRLEKDSDAPIVIFKGTLLSLNTGANADIARRLSKQLKVIDFRPADALHGRPADYLVTEAQWPAIGTAAYREMVATNQLAGWGKRHDFPAGTLK